MNSKNLREKRAPIATAIRELADKANAEERDFTSEEKESWARMNTEYDNLTAQIERAERCEVLDAGQEVRLIQADYNGKVQKERQEDTEETRTLALQAWAMGQAGKNLSTRQAEACAELGIDPYRNREFRFSLLPGYAPKTTEEVRALSLSTGSAGGYTVPTTFVNQLEEALLFNSELRRYATIIRTDGTEPMAWATVNDTANEGRILSEGSAATELDPSFGQVSLNAYTYTSDFVYVPNSLLLGSAFSLSSYLARWFGERFARITNRHATVGSGANAPHGYMVSGTLGKTAASSTAVTIDEIMDLVSSLDPAYLPNAAFSMHHSIKWTLRKLKDGNGNYLWQSSLMAGQPDMLLGYPVFLNQHQDSAMTTGKKIIAFGDFSKLIMREVNSFRMVRAEERRIEYDQTAFIGFMYFDATVLDAGTHPIKYLALA